MVFILFLPREERNAHRAVSRAGARDRCEPGPCGCLQVSACSTGCSASHADSSSSKSRERVRKRRPVGLSSENIPPLPGTQSMMNCVCRQYSNFMAAERRMCRIGVVAVRPYSTSLNRAAETIRACAVACPDTGAQAVQRAPHIVDMEKTLERDRYMPQNITLIGWPVCEFRFCTAKTSGPTVPARASQMHPYLRTP